MDRFRDLLRMRATRTIGIGQDHNMPILEVQRQRGIPLGRCTLGSRRGHEADLGEGIGVLLAFDKVDQCRLWGCDQLRQAIWNLRAIRLALGPAAVFPVILRELLFAGRIPALSDLEVALAVVVVIDVFGEHGPRRLAGLRLRLGVRQTKLRADMIATIFPVVAREAVGHKAFAIRRVRFHRQATITGTVSRTRAKHFSALHVAPEQLGDLRD